MIPGRKINVFLKCLQITGLTGKQLCHVMAPKTLDITSIVFIFPIEIDLTGVHNTMHNQNITSDSGARTNTAREFNRK